MFYQKYRINNYILILAFLCVLLAFSFLIVKDFAHPLIGFGDTEQWEYAGFYLRHNIKFTPFPQLDLVNNQAFYPYGTNQVFQPWSIERDIFYAIFSSILGLGPWLKIYYLLSVLITGVGSFALLIKDYGFVRASGAAFIIPFFSFYAIHKYPEHLSYSVIHWTVLNVIADFLILKRIALGGDVSLKLLLIRACLLSLSLGQELGYIAGCALMSFTISNIFAVILISYKFLIQKNITLIKLFKTILQKYKSELYSNINIYSFLLCLLLVITFINFPLAFQIAREAKSFDFTNIPSGAWWADPQRILIPFFPFYHPGKISVEVLFNDFPEGLGAGSPGWFLLTIASIGLWQGRKQIIIYIPLLIIFWLCIFYHPTYFPTLKMFPWFAFSRVQGRFTILYPVILCLLGLNINLSNLQIYIRRLVITVLVILACTEIYTAYSLYSDNTNKKPVYFWDNNFLAYMKYVKAQPGEAILDWPFCAVGGNGVGTSNLCRYYGKNGSISTLRRFHEKKVLGHYFGRLHPSQLKPYLDAGWDKLFAPDNENIMLASHQTRCFNADEWNFFTDFFKLNDFAGINLYVDFFSQDCVQEFYTRFGQPVIETKVPSAGLVKFIPKPANLKNQVNLNLGRTLKFEPYLDLSQADLLKFQVPYGLNLTGLNQGHLTNNSANSWRWGLVPETELRFKLHDSKLLTLNFTLMNPLQGQDLLIEINGATVEKINDINKDIKIESKIEFKSLTGVNTIVFKYKYWPDQKVTFSPGDKRSFAVKFLHLALEEKSSKAN
ncbi:hypothetical protein [Nostoc sp. FACHB-110]|uniref:hypothetical protein n=1 Tax=Nostoc sp. FACHB-110 TaxID=2692834 RepID=UPI001688AE48|nr:hypothetical protein [Nostoc sp. FACHB-110]MBD2436664.1 hypothetical protein [Nostoc sp. FACHB-110]